MSGTMARPDRERDSSVDVARGMAIVLVVLGHNRALSSSAPAMIDALFLFHVPLFFLLSGLVQREQPWLESTRSLARRLLLPFLVAGLLVGIAKLVVRGGSFVELLAGMAWATGQTLPWSHLWFLPALFLALLLTQLMRRVPGGAMRWVLASLLAAGVIVFLPPVAGPVGWPWSVDLLPYCLLFVWLGAWLNASPRLRAAIQNPGSMVLAAAVFVFALRAHVDLNMRVFTPPALATLAAISGCIVTLAAARGLALLAVPRRLFATIGQHTLAIFLLHVSIQKALLDGSTWWVSGVLAAAAAIVISMLASAAMRWLLARWKVRHARLAPPATREVTT